MKIIEALKVVKHNRDKIEDLVAKIKLNSARKSFETSPYDNPELQVKSWVDAIEQLALDNEKLLYRIHKTNLLTPVTIEIGGRQIEKSIDEWIYRRREGASIAAVGWKSLTDRGLKDEQIKQSDGTYHEVKVVRHYNTVLRDEKLAVYMAEPSLIDARLEIVNATTDLCEEGISGY